MIHHDLLNLIRRERRFEDFLHPYYGSYSIAEVVPTVIDLFGIKQDRSALPLKALEGKQGAYKKIILLIVDGLGYSHFTKYYDRYPFLTTLAKKGDVYPITSVFPSTTTAALTALHTGLTPQEHGLPEWTVYFEEFDSIIETLAFKTWDMDNVDGLLRVGGEPEMLYEGKTIYRTLKDNKVEPKLFISQKYTGSAYSRAVHEGSTVVGCQDAADMCQKLIKELGQDSGQTYYSLYWGQIDSIAHEHGPDSPEYMKAMDDFMSIFQHEVIEQLTPELAAETLLMVTADHGHVNIKGEEIINLNRYPQIDKNLMHSKNGKRIRPTGSPHDVFLFIEPDKLKEVHDFLKDELAGRAKVLTIDEALEKGLFGLDKPTDKFLRRIGNLIILPFGHQHVWYEFFPHIPYHMKGIHGGLSEDEMTVPLALLPLAKALD